MEGVAFAPLRRGRAATPASPAPPSPSPPPADAAQQRPRGPPVPAPWPSPLPRAALKPARGAGGADQAPRKRMQEYSASLLQAQRDLQELLDADLRLARDADGGDTGARGAAARAESTASGGGDASGSCDSAAAGGSEAAAAAAEGARAEAESPEPALGGAGGGDTESEDGGSADGGAGADDAAVWCHVHVAPPLAPAEPRKPAPAAGGGESESTPPDRRQRRGAAEGAAAAGGAAWPYAVRVPPVPVEERAKLLEEVIRLEAERMQRRYRPEPDSLPSASPARREAARGTAAAGAASPGGKGAAGAGPALPLTPDGARARRQWGGSASGSACFSREEAAC